MARPTKKTAPKQKKGKHDKLDDDELTKKLLSKFGCCPSCGSDSINAGDHDGDTVVSFACDCDDCGATWTEHYRFVSASDHDPGS